MKRILILLYLSLIHADFKECGTILDPFEYELRVREYSEIKQTIDRDQMPDIIWAPITFHIVRSDNGTGGLPPHRIETGLQDMLNIYSGANILPYRLGEIDYIDNTDFLSINSYDEMEQLKQVNVVENSINIYSVDLLSNGEYDLCGISTFTWSSYQGIIMSNSCFATSDNHSTLAHELGHYFNLYHTHQGSGSPNDDGVIQGNNTEYVDGTECNTRGDGLCDTPADPTLSDLVNNSCEYFGTYVDGHGDLFDPDEMNLMSYSQKWCRDFLSEDQNIKSVYTIQSERPELNYPPIEPFIVLVDSTVSELLGDGDGVINPFESVEISVTLQNWDNWPDAEEVEIQLITDSPNINIVDGTHYSSSIQSGQQYITDSDPFVIDVLSDLGLFDLKIKVSSINNDGSAYTKEFPIKVDVSLFQSGFPLTGINQVESSPLVLDLDDDGMLDMVFGDYDGLVHFTDHLGYEKDGFPVNVGDDIWGAPASADLDLDGDLEFIIASKNGLINVIGLSGEIELSIDLDQFLMGTPAIGNFDLDNDLEIAIAGYSNSSNLFAINYDGSFVDGFPKYIGEKVLRGPSIYDVNRNGLDDIVIATESDRVYLIYDNGDIADGFPFVGTDKFKSSPSIFDVDGQILILAGSKDGQFNAIDGQGNLLWQIDVGSNISTACSFIDQGSYGGIFFGTELGLLYGYDHEGNILSGFPIETGSSITVSPSFSDLNNNGDAEIVVGNASGDIFIFSLNGMPYDLFPINGGFSNIGSPTISDIDLDLDLDIVFGITSGITVIDIKTDGSNVGYWSMFKGSKYRTGSFAMNLDLGCDEIIDGDLNCDQIIDVSDIVIIVSIILEEYNPELYQELSGDSNGDNILDILDIISIINNILGS